MGLETINKQCIGVLIGAGLGIVSMFLPWLNISAAGILSQHLNGFHNYGIGAFLSFVLAGISGVAYGYRRHSFTRIKKIITLCAGLSALIFTSISFEFNNLGIIERHAGEGIWLSLFAGCLILFSAWLFKNPTNILSKPAGHIKQQISIPITNIKKGKRNISPVHFSELERLISLKESGKITDEEYELLKSMLT